MIKTRLFELLGNEKKYIIHNVLIQWTALIVRIIAVFFLADFLAAAVFGTADREGALRLLIAAAVSIIVRTAAEKLAASASYKAGANVKKVLRDAIYGKVLRLGAGYREHVGTAEIVQLSSEGVEQLETYYGEYLPQFFYSMLAPLTLFAVTAVRISARTAGMLLIFVPLIPLSIVVVQKIAKRLLSRYWSIYAGLGDSFLENLEGLTTLKIYQADGRKALEMDREAEHFRKITMKVLMMQLNSTSVMDIMAYGGAAAGMIVAVAEYMAGSISFAGAAAVMFLAAEYFLPLRKLGSFFHVAMNGMTASDRMFALLDLPEREEGNETLANGPQAVRFSGVHFSYEADREILNGVDFTVPAGAFAAIAGESGCGKSTIAKLLAGRLHVYAGDIRIGDKELAAVREADLLSHVALVESSSYLFAGTVEENLKMAKPNASVDEMRRVLHEVRLLDYLDGEKGLKTELLAGGSNLSGGQAQRLAIARALLSSADVFIFDEASSNIDAESEEMIMDVIRSLAGKKTIIMISHRLHNCAAADVIFMMRDGRIVESGTHEELAGGDGAYAALYRAQRELETYADGHEAERIFLTAGEEENARDEEDDPGDDFVKLKKIQRLLEKYADDTSGVKAKKHTITRRLAREEAERVPEAEIHAALNENHVSAPSGADVPKAMLGADEVSEDVMKKEEPAEKPSLSGFAVMRKLLALSAPLMPVMLLAILLGTAGFLCAIFITIFAGEALLHAAGLLAAPKLLGNDPVKVLFILMIAAAVLRGLLHYAEQYCNHYIAFRLLALIRHKVFEALRRLAPAKMEGRDKGSLISVLTADIELLEVFYAHTISPIAIAILVSGIMTGFMFGIHPLTGAFALFAYLTVGVLVPLWNGKRTRGVGIKNREDMGGLSGYVLDSLRGLDVTLGFGCGETRRKNMAEKAESVAKDTEELAGLAGVQSAVTTFVILAFSFGMAFLASYLAARGEMEPAKVLPAVLAMSGSFGPVTALSALSSSLSLTLGAGDRVLSILAEEPVIKEITAYDRQDSWEGYYHFEGARVSHVFFSYGDEEVLSDVSLTVQKGRIIGIHGPSGSGKSTLLKLLMRFYDADSGDILVSGEDIRRIPTNRLRDAESYVTQTTQLFNDTIAENIAIGKVDASRVEIIRAAKKASLDDFVRTLPKGYDTKVGELGDALSGGERQRIGLARAFLHNAPFMLLDEPTSNLDSLNEGIILKALREDAGERTVLLVTHRKSTMKVCDQVAEMRSGRSL